MEKWNKRFFDLALHASQWSKDNSTKVGAVIINDKKRILSTGYNGFPTGVDDDVEERHQRPKKYFFAEHAERNAIYNSARAGVSLEGSTMYVTMFPCADCARAIIQSGISKLFTPIPDKNREDWKESFQMSLEMLNESGVEVNYFNDNK